MPRHAPRRGLARLRATPRPHPATPARPARAGIPALALVLAAAAGCASTAPPTTAPSAAAPAAPTGGAPAIAHPLPASLIRTDPCRTLTPAQVHDLLGVAAPGHPSDSGIAAVCHWADLDRGSSVTVQFVYAWTDGLGRVYAKKDEGFFRELEPVQGYPIVAYGPTDDSPSGRCGVAVGIAATAAFEADATLPRSSVGREDPCQAARRIADAVLTTAKGGA
uniref:DUF3558 domain-containing protein n=1 Tax=Amycolatopsis sp. CA-096443 TaxID=3239919 RepID=UPI003F4982DB